MNAILVFDPSNDLLFVKSNPRFRCAILKFARANDLLDQSMAGRAPSGTTSHESQPRAAGGRRATPGEGPESSGEHQHKPTRQHTPRRRRRSRHKRPPTLGDYEADISEDTSKCYMDVLMLMLTPYVASLRLANHMGQSRQQQLHQMTSDTIHQNLSDLHEQCQQSNSQDCCDQEQRGSKLDGQKISTSCVPVECLENCQVVYCQLFDFIFVLMQELDVVSSFKMRLLKRRLDTFARLALFLFGQCLNSLKSAHHQATPDGEPDRSRKQANINSRHVDQSLVLRRAFDCWFEHQFEPEFFLEAHEQLILGSTISQLCHDTLKRISSNLRRISNEMPVEENQHEVEREMLRLRHAESHQHAILFSGLKLVSRFSWPGAVAPLGPDDLILLMNLLAAFNADYHNQLPDETSLQEATNPAAPSRASLSGARFVYRSHYLNDKQTYQIHQIDGTTSGQAQERHGHSRDKPSNCFCRRILGKSRPREPIKLPKQFPIFLVASAGGGGQRQATNSTQTSQMSEGLNQLERRLFMPHMLRFVALNDGITLVLISEISSNSYLSTQLSKAHKLLLELTSKISWRDHDKLPEPQMAAVSQLSSASCDRSNLEADRLQRNQHRQQQRQQQQQPDSTRLEAAQQVGARRRIPARGNVARLKLSQLTRANDCMQAIRSYFYRPDLFDVMIHEQRRRHQLNVQLGSAPFEMRAPDAREALDWQWDETAVRRRLAPASQSSQSSQSRSCSSSSSSTCSSASTSSFWSSSRFLAAGWRDAGHDDDDELDVVSNGRDLQQQQQQQQQHPRQRRCTSSASLGAFPTSNSSGGGGAGSILSSFVSRLLNIGQQRETAKGRPAANERLLVVESQAERECRRRRRGVEDEFDENELGVNRASSNRTTGGGGGGGGDGCGRQQQLKLGRQQVKLVIESFEFGQRKLCRHLLRKLGELAQSNMQTYIRQTFGLTVDEHKRDALLSSVCSVVREALSELVLQNQLSRLDGSLDKSYLNYFGARIDQARLTARSELSDYLDYLAVKASCNVTLNAPIAHDMPSVSAFIYLDRSRHQLIVSQANRQQSGDHQVARMNRRELLQADFMGAVERHERILARRLAAVSRANDGDQSRSESDLTASEDEREEEDDDDDIEHEPDCCRVAGKAESKCLIASDADADQSSQSSDAESFSECPPQVSQPEGGLHWRKRVPDASWQSSPDLLTLVSGLRAPALGQLVARRARQPANFTGTSQDVLIDCGGGGGGTSSSSSVALAATSEIRLASALNLHATTTCNLLDSVQDLNQIGQQLQPIRRQVDTNLVKGFTAFIYNRLAQGQVENLTHKDGTYNLTYSMWFKRNSSVWSHDDAKRFSLVTPDQILRSPALLELKTGCFRSFPNVICDDFFHKLTSSIGRFVAAPQPSVHSDGPRRRLRQVKVSARVSELDPKTGRNLTRRRLTRVREEVEDDDGDDDDDDDGGGGDESYTDDPGDGSDGHDMWARRLGSGASGGTKATGRSQSSTSLDQDQDFGAFMRGQQRRPRAWRSARRTAEAEHQLRSDRLACCELFVVHDSDLLVHKSQLEIEAQLLARRLARLMDSVAEPS